MAKPVHNLQPQPQRTQLMSLLNAATHEVEEYVNDGWTISHQQYVPLRPQADADQHIVWCVTLRRECPPEPAPPIQVVDEAIFAPTTTPPSPFATRRSTFRTPAPPPASTNERQTTNTQCRAIIPYQPPVVAIPTPPAPSRPTADLPDVPRKREAGTIWYETLNGSWRIDTDANHVDAMNKSFWASNPRRIPNLADEPARKEEPAYV